MITRARALATGLTALALLVLLVAGLPVILLRFGGSPLPQHAGSWHAFGTALSRPDNGTLLLGIVRELSWLGWLLFTTSVIAEAQAAFRGRRSPHLRLGGLQGAAAHLVALAALAFAAPSAITLSASVTAASGQAVSGQPVGGQEAGGQPAGGRPADSRGGGTSAAGGTAVLYLSTPPASAAPGQDRAVGSPVPAAAPEAQAMDFESAPATMTRLITVRAGDCLWSIAQRYLGAGDRYPEIVRLNYGHDMGDGHVFTNPSLIEPGWQLFVPGDSLAGAGHAEGPGGSTDSTGARGGATAAGSTGRPPAAIISGIRPAIRTTGGGTRPRERERARLPPTGLPPFGSDPLPEPPVRHGTRVGQRRRAPAETRRSIETAASARTSGSELAEAAIFISGALAGSVLTSLIRLRRRQRQERRRGRRIALPADPAVLAAEQRLRAVAPDEPLASLRDALHVLEQGVITAGRQLADIVGLHVTPDVLEVLLAAPAADAPPPPYAISPGRQGMCWQLELPATGPADQSGRTGGGRTRLRSAPASPSVPAPQAGHATCCLA